MGSRFVSIWFRYLSTDWFTLRQLSAGKRRRAVYTYLKDVPFVLRAPSHGRMILTAVNRTAEQQGLVPGMALADARAVIPGLTDMDDEPDKVAAVLDKLARWCIRFSPFVAPDPPDGLFLDATGCAHLWGGEDVYVFEITRKLRARGYDVIVAMADTPGTAWAVSHYGRRNLIVPPGGQQEALLSLPPAALRLEAGITDRLHKLGLQEIRQFMNMPRNALRRRFGESILLQLDKALGHTVEKLQPVVVPEPFQERLPSLEPVSTPTGIAIALEELLKKLCHRLQQEQKGLRTAIFKGFRVDGKVISIAVATHSPSHDVRHLLRLFTIKVPTLEPGLGIELFVLEAPKVEAWLPQQERMWEDRAGLEDARLSELVDRLTGKLGEECLHRFLPAEHYWPERSYTAAGSLQERATLCWGPLKPRPLHLLAEPEPIEVTAPIPDYPPMLFRHKGVIHKISRADGPERIEQEWWISEGRHRDYYRVEDDNGHRYWIFRSGHYHDKTYQWFLHGFFA